MRTLSKIKPITFLKLIAGVSTLLPALNLMAFERDHDAHVHGHSSLAIAIEKNVIQLEFFSPAMNIVGFEHTPSSKADKEQVSSAEIVLKKGETLFLMNPESACQLSMSSVKSELIDSNDDHDEDHKTDHSHHDAHEHEHEEEHEHEKEHDNHSDFMAEYRFECKHIEKLSYIDVKLINVFPTIEEIETQLITESRQSLIELDQKNQRLTF